MSVIISIKDWAILIDCKEMWKDAYIAFRAPTFDGNEEYHISVYPENSNVFENLKDENEIKLLNGLEFNKKHWCYLTLNGVENRKGSYSRKPSATFLS